MERLIKLLPWVDGRQGTGYKKLKLFSLSFMDNWLLYFPQGSNIPLHSDSIPGRKHYRLNTVLVKPKNGGCFYSYDGGYNNSRINFFKSDRPHEVGTTLDGYRLVLSFGYFPKESKLAEFVLKLLAP